MDIFQWFQARVADQTLISSLTVGRAISLAVIILLSCWCIVIGSRQSLIHWMPLKRRRLVASELLINKRVAALIPIFISVLLFVQYISTDAGSHKEYSANVDILTQIAAVHVPVWLSALSLQILLHQHLDRYFLSFYILTIKRKSGLLSRLELSVSLKWTWNGLLSTLAAAGVGAYHELYGNWITHNILCLATTIVLLEVIQLKSFSSGVIFLLGMIWFDLFWMYGINLLSTVVKETKAPIMLFVPKNLNGDFQKLATLDIIVPGLFLALVLRSSSIQRDNRNSFRYGLLGFALGLVITFAIALLNARTTPAMVAPSILCVLFSLGSAKNMRNLATFSHEAN